jgi:hypothetical protein
MYFFYTSYICLRFFMRSFASILFMFLTFSLNLVHLCRTTALQNSFRDDDEHLISLIINISCKNSSWFNPEYFLSKSCVISVKPHFFHHISAVHFKYIWVVFVRKWEESIDMILTIHSNWRFFLVTNFNNYLHFIQLRNLD